MLSKCLHPPAKDDSVARMAWNAEEVRRFLQVASDDRLAPIWRLALASGLRRGELCGLKWSDVDGDRITVRRQLLVHPGRTWDEDRVFVRETTKSRRVRVVSVDEATAAVLRRWKVHQAEERLAFEGAYQDGDWIVAEADGSVVHPSTLSSRWKRLETRADVRQIGLHGARHTHATLSLAAGARLDVVSRQLGHASIAITADIYGHPDADAQAAAAAKLRSVLDG
jgi:integrase